MTAGETNVEAKSPDRLTLALTGATGAVGAAVVRAALAAGHRAIALLRPQSDPSRLAAFEGRDGWETLTSPGLQDPALARSLAARRPDALIHLAWRGTHGKDRNAAFQVTENLPLAISAVELAAAAGCRQWIGIGSQTEYGNPDLQTDERSPALPTSLYGRAKLAACWAGLGLCQARAVTGTWVRIYQLYGPEDEPHRLIPYVIQEFAAGRSPRVTACEQRWDYLHLDDAARAIVRIAEVQAGGLFNLGSGEAVVLKQIVEAIRQQIDPAIAPAYGAVPYAGDRVMHLQADIDRLRRATGWEPQIDLQTGIRQTVDWFRRSAR